MNRFRFLTVSVAVLCLCTVAIVLYVARRPAVASATSDDSSATIPEYDLEHPCALVSAVIALQLLGHPVQLADVGKEIKRDGVGRTSMAELISGMRKLGFAGIGLKATPAALKKLRGRPLIAYTDQSHFLVVLPVGDGSLVVIDPPSEVRAETLDSLSIRWSGEMVLVANTPEELGELLQGLGIADSTNISVRE
jgi:ABC-type bacteriocin/lantibiotic exporter with double-glycine peptidase domain